MKVSEKVAAHAFPNVHVFIEQVLDLQFADVRAMLQLPRPHQGIVPGCNFAIVSTLCNLISGISTTIYKPNDLIHEVESKCSSGHAFKGLVRDFYPLKRPGTNDIPECLYDLCRNPLSHSAGIVNAKLGTIKYLRVLHAAHEDTGWDDNELDDLERIPERFRLPFHSLQIQGQEWTIHCESFYLDVIKMLQNLIGDPTQAQKAEDRFSQGVHVWRKRK